MDDPPHTDPAATQDAVPGGENTHHLSDHDFEDPDLNPLGNGNFTDSGNESTDSQPDVDFQDNCLKTCKPPFQDRREAAHRRKLRLKRMRAYLAQVLQQANYRGGMLRGLRREINDLRQRHRVKPRKVETTWRARLAKVLLGELGPNDNYEKIYKTSCKEENTSPEYLHPELRLTAPIVFELPTDAGILPDTASPNEAAGGNESGPIVFTKKFPPELLVKILKLVVVFPGELVHVVSRLDQYHSPDVSDVLRRSDDRLDRNGTKVRLLHRFLIGAGPFSLTDAPKPNELLAPLIVCRQWHYIACNLFYSCNQFCFSSLGELGRFAGGIGSRLQRVQHMELLWIGSQDVSFKVNEDGRYVSRRTQPLSYLPEALRLKNVSVYLRASHPNYRRRKHEKLGKVRFDKRHTIRKPNFRMHRDLHTVQGMDNIRCLRGTHAVQFWDYDAFLEFHERNLSVRDEDFVVYVNDTTGRAKDPQAARLAEFANLEPLCIAFAPTRAERRAVEEAITVQREDDDARPDISPVNWPAHGPGSPAHEPGDGGDYDGDDDDDEDDDAHHGPGGPAHGPSGPAHGSGGPAHGPGGEGYDSDEDDDNDAPHGPGHNNGGHNNNNEGHHDSVDASGAPAAPVTIDINDGEDDDMPDAPPDGEHIDDDVDMGEAGDDNVAAAPIPGAPSVSPPLFGSLSPPRDPSPGQAQTTWRYSPTVSPPGDSNTSVAQEGSLFVTDSRGASTVHPDDEAGAGGGAAVLGKRPRQDWEDESSDEEEEGGASLEAEDEGVKKEESSDEEDDG